ncbi:hypothetical protein BH11PLA1_BH11PLA1_11140 [soil metagenome]
MVWLTGAALVVSILMIVGLLALILLRGTSGFWPDPIALITLKPSPDAAPDAPTSQVFGIAMRREAFTDEATRAESSRTLFRVGNRDVRNETFIWVDDSAVAAITYPADATLLERTDWGIWLGTLQDVVESDSPLLSSSSNPSGAGVPPAGQQPPPAIQSSSSFNSSNSSTSSIQNPKSKIQTLLPLAHARSAALHHLNTSEIGAISRDLDALRIDLRQREIDLARAAAAAASPSSQLPRALWYASLPLALLGLATLTLTRPRTPKPPAPTTSSSPRASTSSIPSPFPPQLKVQTPKSKLLFLPALTLTILALSFAWLERPTSLEHATPAAVAALTQDLEAARAAAETERLRLTTEHESITARAALLDAQDARTRLISTEPATGRFAPESQSDPATPMRLSQVVRMVQPNTLTWFGKVGVYLDRWREFIFDDPRAANTEGGIFPVIVGTVVLTMLLSVVVVPLGVLAAIYLREYARQGPLTTAVRIAINNLAGVPSIVYGIFGLGFFCYTVGGFIDTGPAAFSSTPAAAANIASPAAWWFAFLILGALFTAACILSLRARPIPNAPPARARRSAALLAASCWFAALLAAGFLIATTPYFHGFFAAHDAPRFGSKGMLWSALTLSLLTLPVVIVATEEAIAAVPRTMREGSYGCGASKWQTIQRIVLPRAMPGIMTGAILAMARGAGEVAPLMLVGAMKLAPELPLDTHFPFLHLDRSFMHLGFHVYDVGFQSPDAEAARPIVWSTVLVLILVVVVLNAAAVRIRSQLRRRFHGETF